MPENGFTTNIQTARLRARYCRSAAISVGETKLLHMPIRLLTGKIILDMSKATANGNKYAISVGREIQGQ